MLSEIKCAQVQMALVQENAPMLVRFWSMLRYSRPLIGNTLGDSARQVNRHGQLPSAADPGLCF